MYMHSYIPEMLQNMLYTQPGAVKKHSYNQEYCVKLLSDGQ